MELLGLSTFLICIGTLLLYISSKEYHKVVAPNDSGEVWAFRILGSIAIIQGIAILGYTKELYTFFPY